MRKMDTIHSIRATEILTSTGRPTVGVRLTTARGIEVWASVPSGTSTGQYEAKVVLDGGTRYGGRGVRRAVANVNDLIAPALIGEPTTSQEDLDGRMIELDGTPDKHALGSNAILAVSVALAKAGARGAGVPLYTYLGNRDAATMPVSFATIIAGGSFAPSPLDFEDYLIAVPGASSFADSVEALVAIRACLGERLRARFGPVPEEGTAFSPQISETPEALDLMLQAAGDAGYGGKVVLGLDVVAGEFYDARTDRYRIGERLLTAQELQDVYTDLVAGYPMVFVEDPYHDDDFAGFARLTAALQGTQIVGDDLFASNPGRLARGIEEEASNGLLLKVNQIGTVTEACRAGRMALDVGYTVTVSLRSSDTNDPFIADLAVGLGATQMKLGCPIRGERIAKYNRLLEIEADLGDRVRYAGAGFVVTQG